MARCSVGLYRRHGPLQGLWAHNDDGEEGDEVQDEEDDAGDENCLKQP